MLRRLTAKQLRDWEIYYALEPFGEERADWRAASIREMVHNVSVEARYRKPIEHFLLKFEEKKEATRQTPEQQFEMMKLLAAAHAAMR